MYEAVKCGFVIGVLAGIVVYLTKFYDPAVVGLLATFPLSIIYFFFIEDEKEASFAKMFLLGSLAYLSSILLYYKLSGNIGKRNSTYISISFWVICATILYIIFIA